MVSMEVDSGGIDKRVYGDHVHVRPCRRELVRMLAYPGQIRRELREGHLERAPASPV